MICDFPDFGTSLKNGNKCAKVIVGLITFEVRKSEKSIIWEMETREWCLISLKIWIVLLRTKTKIPKTGLAF